MKNKPLVSIVTPTFNEQESLPFLYQRYVEVFEGMDADWEWIAIDDHSTDETPRLLENLVSNDKRVRSVRFSRNFGSHIAVLCGLRYSRGDCVVVMASDLQDPPEVIPRLFEQWQAGAKTVWAVREKREAESFVTLLLARIYYKILQTVAKLEDTPDTGADMWIMDRQVVDAVNADPERHSSVIALIRWMGFAQESIYYTKEARRFGASKWSFSRKVNLAISTIIASTGIPIRLMTYVGFLTASLGFLYALFIIIHYFSGAPTQGWSSLMSVLLVVSGVQMSMLGILGEYLWRTYEESRKRPRYIVEKLLNIQKPEPENNGRQL